MEEKVVQPNPLEDDDSINNSIQSSEVRDEGRQQQGLPVVQQGQLPPPPPLLYRQPHLQPLPSSSPSFRSCEEGSSKEDTEEDQGLSDDGNLQAEMESKEEFCDAGDSLDVNLSENQRMETSNETSNTSTQPEDDDNNAQQPNNCPLEEEKTDIEDKSVVPLTTPISSDITTSSTTSNVQNLLSHEQSLSQDASQQQPSSIGSRRPSRNCKPNSLIFNEDTTTLDSPVKRKRRKTDDSGTSGDDNKDSVTLNQQQDLNTIIRNIGSNKRIRKSNLVVSETIQEEVPEDPQVLSRITSSGRRSFVRESVRNAVSSLTKRRTSITSATQISPTSDSIPSNKISLHGRSINGVSLKGKKLGRPRKYPFDSPVKEDPLMTPPQPTDLIPLKEKKVNKKPSPSTSATSKKTITTNHNNLNHHINNGHHNQHSNRKSTSSPATNKTKMTPILTAILSGQDISSTKTGRPKGRPRILPSLDKVILNGTSVPLSSTPIVPIVNLKKSSRTSPKKGSSCDCESRYKLILSELEESLESKFRESTARLRKDIEERDNENIRLHGRIVALQKEMDMLKKKLEQVLQPPTAQPFAPIEVEELKERHKAEISRIKKTQWCSNCEQKSIYFCCWNTSYCSLECQQAHWHAVHKKKCQRRQMKDASMMMKTIATVVR